MKKNKFTVIICAIGLILASFLTHWARNQISANRQQAEEAEKQLNVQREAVINSLNSDSASSEELAAKFREATAVINGSDKSEDSSDNTENGSNTNDFEITSNMYWFAGQDKNSVVKGKEVPKDDTTFVDNYIAQYSDTIVSVTETINIAGKSMKEYNLGNERFVYVFEFENNDTKTVSCVYVDWRDAESLTDSDDQNLKGYFPTEDMPEYTFSKTSCDGYTKEDYSGPNDSGTKYYDAEGRLVYCSHYLTSGSRDLFVIWKDGKIAMIVDTGGMPYGGDSEDPDVYVGMITQIYRFKDPIDEADLYNYLS